VWHLGKEKKIPQNILNYCTPLCRAIWIIGDGSGMKEGGFKISSHSFSRIGSEAGYRTKELVMPYLLSSSYYKFRFCF
jgi:hypothetical protein